MDVDRSRAVDAGAASSLVDGMLQLKDHVREDDKLSDDILVDFETYWQDISDRLTVSRMVSDSVIKGIVNAVREEADKNVADKEAELAELKETLYVYHAGAEDAQYSGCPDVCHEAKDSKNEISCGVSCSKQCERTEESVHTLGNIAKAQLTKLKRDIDSVKRSDTVKRLDSGLQFHGIRPELLSERWADVDKSLKSLAGTVECLCSQVTVPTSLTQASLSDWQHEQEFLCEIRDMVTKSCIRGLQEQYEEKLPEQSAKFLGKEAAYCVRKINEISSLREQLEAISKSLSHIETGYLASHGLNMREECGDSKSSDHVYHKHLGHVWEANGKHEVSTLNLPVVDRDRLKHMSSEKLIHFYDYEILMMKRNHESELQDMTEKLYTLKREVLRLKERGLPVPLKRDKEMDTLRKKIQEFILKMECVIKGSDKFSSANSAESTGSMKRRLESLVLENNHLKDLLAEKDKEIRALSLQVTDATERISQYYAAEVNFITLIERLQSELEDAHVEDALHENLYKCVLRELTGQVRSIIEESVLINNVMNDIYETLFEDATRCAESNGKYEIEDFEVQNMVMKELCGVVFIEALKDTAKERCKLGSDYIKGNKIRGSLELAAITKKNLLRAEVAENEILKKNLKHLAASRAEQDKLAVKLASELAKQRDQLLLAIQEHDKLKDQTSHQQMLISKAAEELNVTRGNLVEAQRQVAQYEEEVKEMNEERKRLLSLITQEKQNFILQSHAQEREHMNQLKSTVLHIQEFMKSIADTEKGVREGCRKVSSSLGNLSSQVNPLVQKATTLRKTRSIYKLRLERKCYDLQKAEAEVDLLGDEVDALLSLLEKVYIALDHYSPILRHYPGITEILKLVKRELCGGFTKNS